MLVLLIEFIIVVVIAAKSIKIVKQSEMAVIERLGKFYKLAEPGLTVVVPFIDKVRAYVSTSMQSTNVTVSNVHTMDERTIEVNATAFFTIYDPCKAVYEVKDVSSAINTLIVAKINAIASTMTANEMFASRETINKQLVDYLDLEVDKWGCRCNNFLIDNINM
jgi:regulator of protease activity HflC (stomatin/prohibitin superfamily)